MSLASWFRSSRTGAFTTSSLCVDPAPERPAPEGSLWVEVAVDQPHPVDLRWADELMTSARPHLMVRPKDELLILVPNRPIKINATAYRVLGNRVHDGAGAGGAPGREGDSRG